MGVTKLCLLLLLGTYTLAQQDVGSSEEYPSCPLAKRFKNFRRYIYNYEAASVNLVNGASDSKSGPKVTCKVEVDVPQTCSFIVRTSECSLMEISGLDSSGNPVYIPVTGSETFREAMAKNPLKFFVSEMGRAELFSEDDEPAHILNIKRGIVAALIVPGMEEESLIKMDTVRGFCPSVLTVNAREDIATDVTVERDLAQCNASATFTQHTSPIALISNLDLPLSKLVSSSQTCNYKFDNQKRHMTGLTCTESHLFLPFSSDYKYGISSQVQTTMTLREISKINDRVFERELTARFLSLDPVDDKSPVQTKDAALALLKELLALKDTTNGEKRANLFRRLASELRSLKSDAVEAAALEMFDLSQRMTFQALAQCGSPECVSGLLRVLRTFPPEALEVDAIVYALGMLPYPSRLMVKDMLAMAQYKQSKAIMYALGNAARKLANTEGPVPEVKAVSDYFNSILGADCSGDKELTYLTLRVVGSMGDVLEEVDPSIKGTLLKCMRQPATTLSVQLAAIQAFRRMQVTDEVRSNLQRVAQYPKGAVQKRLAAFLMVMRNYQEYQDSDIEMVKKLMEKEQNVQVKSFVTSYVYNILTSSDADLVEFRSQIEEALQDKNVVDDSKYTQSKNYKFPGIKGNVIFDPNNQLPREVMLETTLDAFGYKMDILEFGMEGKGFEPTVDALFGKNGFFPDTISKTLYWAEDNMPPKFREVLNKWAAPLKMDGQTVPEDLIREIVRNFNKLVKDLQNMDAPDATAYLKFLGNELGFIKTNELESVAQNVAMYAEIFLHLMPREQVKSFLAGDNDLFAHYIFMDNKFSLPTASGLPLRFEMSGTFTPGLMGGVTFNPKMKELVFRPSAGVEFVTKMGVHFPEFAEAAVEMTTNLYHESSLNARLSMGQGQIKLTVPAPQDNTKLLHIRNKVMVVGPFETAVVPATESDTACRPAFPGLKLCSTVMRGDSGTDRPYFPLNGETLFALDLKPTMEVSEYTATIGYDVLSEGKDGRQKVDTVKVALRAEGAEPTEATLTLRYNRNRNVFTTQLEIPDMDVEAGLKLAMTDSNSKGKSLTLEISNKNVPQLSLIGRAKLQGNTEGMVQVQLLVPSLKTDAALTATVNRADGLVLELRSDVSLPETTSIQAVTFKYGQDQVEMKLMSNVNADTKVTKEYTDAAQTWFREMMGKKVGNTDMTMRHIFNKGLEAGLIWLETRHVRALEEYLSNVEIPAMPENLFMNFESAFKYSFNKDTMVIFLPVPYGGMSSEDLRVPAMVSTPRINVPQLNLDLSPREIPVPTFTLPYELEFSVPLLGKMEMSTKVENNFYNWEATATVGNFTEDSPSYRAEYNVKGESPISLLSFTNAGTAELFEEFNGVTTSLFFGFRHQLLRSEIKVRNNFGITDNIWSGGRIAMTAKCPGMETSMSTSAQFTLAPAMFSGDMNSDASMTIGPMFATCTSQNTFSFEPAKKEAKAESTVRFNSEIVKVANKIKMSYANNELAIDSNTNMNSEPLKHTTKVNLMYKDVKLSIQADSVTKATEEKMLRSQMELLASGEQVTLRIENQADDSENRAYSLLTGSLSPSSLEINSDASVNILASLASHKATLTLDSNGLTTSCTTTAQFTPFTFENVFHAGADFNGATMSLTTKGGIRENKAEMNVEGKIASSEVYLNGIMKGNVFDLNGRNRVNFRFNEDGVIASNNMVASYNEVSTKNSHTLSLTLRSLTLQSKTENFFNNKNTYLHDVNINVDRLVANVIVKNEMKIMDVNFNNDAQFKAEPYTVELVGTMMSSYKEEEMRHTYEFKFVDMVLSAKCNTNGKLLGSHMTHSTDMELSGLTFKFNDVANLNSPFLRMDSTVKTLAEPFILNVDAIFNSNGEINFSGQKSGEMYSKFLMKAEPLMFTHSFEYRASANLKDVNDEAIIMTNMDNKFNSLFSLKEQSVTLKMTSIVNEHTFDQELNAFNNAEKVGIEMSMAASTSLLAKKNGNYNLSGFVIYEKNGESHIMIPFVEHLPVVVENVKNAMMTLMDQGIEMIKDINNKYKISMRLQNKVTELKEVIDNFDVNLFVQDVKKFLSSIESTITNFTANFPTDKVVAMLKSIKDTIMAWIKKYNIVEKFNVIYGKMEQILSNYRVEDMIGAFMDETVKIMKQYQVREKIQAMFAAIRSIDIKPIVQKVMLPIQGFVAELYAVDYKQFVEDMNNFVLRILEKIRSFDYETFTMEVTETLKRMSAVPCMGKLSGEVKLVSPDYKMKTNVNFENNTISSETPHFLLNFNSNADSTLKVLAYTLDSCVNVVLPRMSHLAFTESFKFDQSSLQINHQGSMNIYRHSALATAETTAKADTELYKGELINKASLAFENGVFSKVETTYKQDVRFPPLKFISDMALNQITILELQDGSITLKMENAADGKMNNHDANHKSDMEFVFDIHTAKVTFNGATGCTNMKVTQKLDADICIFQHFIVNAKMETEAPFFKSSVAEAKFQAKVEELKIDFTASHNTELVGKIEGTVANSIEASVTPDDIIYDAKNKANAKVSSPFQLPSKIDLQNDFSFALNPVEQRSSWTGLARFNQYKYSHFISMDNVETEMNILYQINGEANLDVLKQRITLPEIDLPFFDMTIPRTDDFSLWEDAGLSDFFITTQQTLDINSNLKYVKNPDMIIIDINMEPYVNAINTNAKAIQKMMLSGKNKAAGILDYTYGKAKEGFEKYSVELPKTVTIPAYRIPLMDVKMSTYTFQLPDASLVRMPSFRVPSMLRKITLPEVTMPINSIRIPRLGEMTYAFSMKTAMITLKADASLMNQDGIVMKLDASSTSEFEILSGKVEGSAAAMMTNDGYKLDSNLAVKNLVTEFNHENAIFVAPYMVDVALTNSAHYGLSKFDQIIKVNPNEGLIMTVSSPSGLIGGQIQPKNPTTMKARIYGRYPYENDIDIISLKVSVMESLNVQTSWNMEMPYDVMLSVKQSLPSVQFISELTTDFYSDLYDSGVSAVKGVRRSFEKVKREGKFMFRNALEAVESMDLKEYMDNFANNVILILREYRVKIEMIFDAVFKFLNKTTFRIPYYNANLTGAELYEVCSNFIADTTNNFIRSVSNYPYSFPQFVTAMEYFKSLEFQFSNYIVKGSEIMEDFAIAFNRLKQQVMTIVRKMGYYPLENIMANLNAFVQFFLIQAEKYLVAVQSLNADKITNFMSEVYEDAVNSPVLKNILVQCEKIYMILWDYYRAVKGRVIMMSNDISLEQLNDDIQSCMDRMIKNVNALQNNVIETLKEESKAVETYVKVSDRNMEIDIPIPFFM